MNVGPVSGDLVVKLAIIAGVAGVAVYAFKRIKPSLPNVPSVGGIVDSVNPLNHDNVFASTLNDWGKQFINDPQGSGMNADGSWTFGGWLYDVTHPAEAQAVRDVTKPIPIPTNTGGATGSWAPSLGWPTYDPTPGIY